MENEYYIDYNNIHFQSDNKNRKYENIFYIGSIFRDFSFRSYAFKKLLYL